MPSTEDYLHDILGVAESMEKLLQSIDNSLSSIAENIDILAAVAKGRQCAYCGGSLDDGNSHLHGGDLNPGDNPRKTSSGEEWNRPPSPL